MAKNQYVVRHDSGWAVRSESSKRVTKVFATQKEAVSFAVPIAKKNESELRVQGRDGKFRTCNSYGNDPCPPRDKNR